MCASGLVPLQKVVAVKLVIPYNTKRPSISIITGPPESPFGRKYYKLMVHKNEALS